MPLGSDYPPQSKEKRAEFDRYLDECYDQQLQRNEKELLESCAWFHEGEDCDCKGILKEMQEKRAQWWKETLEKRASASNETVSDIRETPEKGTGPSEEAVSDEW
jgi:hypothetical protein